MILFVIIMEFIDDNEYSDVFSDFVNRTNEKEIFINKLNKYISNYKLKNPYPHILFIGSGDGIIEEEIYINNNECRMDLIEPNDKFIGILENKFIKAENVNVYHSTLENFDFTDSMYDIIILSHSIYYMNNIKHLLLNLYYLCDNLIIYLQNSNCFTYYIQYHILNDKAISSFEIKNILDNILSDEHGINYDEELIECFFECNNITDKLLEFISNKKIDVTESKKIKRYLGAIMNDSKIIYYNSLFIIH